MSPASLYLDHNAGAPLRPQARDAMLVAMQVQGNPSSVHRDGRAARALLESARDSLAALMRVRAQDVIFTSGATESLQLAFEAALASGFGPVFVSATEHDALAALAPARAPHLRWIPAREDGVADLDWLEEQLVACTSPPLVVLQAANNETGALQDLGRVSRLLGPLGGALIVDAAQAFGKLEVGAWTGIGAWTAVSAHKLGGPAGVGALVLQPGSRFPSLRPGGGQERGRRAGAQNVLGAVGFAAAAEAAAAALLEQQALWGAERSVFEGMIQRAAPQATVFAASASRLANTSYIALPDIPAERTLIGLDLAGVSVSSGAACSSGSVKASRVLLAMGVAEALARCAVRLSFGWTSQPGDGAKAASALIQVIERQGGRNAGR